MAWSGEAPFHALAEGGSMRVDDGLLGLLLLVVAGAVYLHAQTFPRLAFMQFGPSLFPSVIAGGLGLCGAALVLQSGVRRWAGRGGAWLDLDPWARTRRGLLGLGLVVLAVLAFGLALPRLGYHLTALPVLLLLFWWLRVRAVVALPVAVLTTALTHQLFAVALRVPLPWGLLEPVAW